MSNVKFSFEPYPDEPGLAFATVTIDGFKFTNAIATRDAKFIRIAVDELLQVERMFDKCAVRFHNALADLKEGNVTRAKVFLEECASITDDPNS